MVDAVSQWNVSPKLGNSDNEPSRRHVPAALGTFRELESAYFKFVMAEPADLDEASRLVETYDIPPGRVVLMPEGVTAEDVTRRGRWVAQACTERGYRFSTRLHILLWGDERGR
jgi:organic radical activating enzyme